MSFLRRFSVSQGLPSWTCGEFTPCLTHSCRHLLRCCVHPPPHPVPVPTLTSIPQARGSNQGQCLGGDPAAGTEGVGGLQ